MEIKSGRYNIGSVSSVNAENRTVRVAISGAGGNSVSGALKVLRTSAEEWLPEVGDCVLCVFLPNGSGDGVVLGGLS
jgi:phage baseplate assembly protein gpV